MLTRLPSDVVFPKTPFLAGFARAAEESGLDALGILAERENLPEFRREISFLQSEYPLLRLQLFCIVDAYDEEFENSIPAVAGTVRSVYTDGKRFRIDTEQNLSETLKIGFRGDSYLFMQSYAKAVRELTDRFDCKLMFDFESFASYGIFDKTLPEYRRGILNGIDRLIQREIPILLPGNSKKFCSPLCIRRLGERRGMLTPASLADEPGNLFSGCKEAMLYARAGGVGGVTILTHNGWEKIPIKI